MAEILASWLVSGPRGWDLGLEVRIWTLRLGFWPRGCDFGLKTGILASRLGFEGVGMEEEEEEENSRISVRWSAVPVAP